MSGADSIKVVLLGEAGVGKTSIIHQFTYHKFDPDCISSISAQFISKTIEYQGYGAIKYDIWDTAGQERYRSMAKIFYKDARVIVFVYDITSESTFDGMKDYWYEQTKINCEKDAILAVVANKNDLYGEQVVSDEIGQQFADEIGAIFQSTSALSESGINKLFDNIGKKIIDPDFDYKDSDKVAKANYDKKQNNQKDEEKDKRVKLGDAKNNNNNKKGGCCNNS
jgi:small GTP-binding protein